MCLEEKKREYVYVQSDVIQSILCQEPLLFVAKCVVHLNVRTSSYFCLFLVHTCY